MSAPSPRCGRLDDHAPHTWIRPAWWGVASPVQSRTHECPGHVVTEGAQPCVHCQRAAVACRCAEQRAAERGAEWWAD